MARKGLLESVIASGVSKDGVSQSQKRELLASRADYAMRGASRSMKMSIDEMADSARRLADGDAIVKIDPALIESSFINDRLNDDESAFESLKETIAEHGQETPVLLRPHPEQTGRYMVVFGHRRVRVARSLGIEVRAIVRDMEETSHVIAQGQENAAREDLSFIEKALYAKKIVELGHGKNVARAALAIDQTLLSRMLSVTAKVPDWFIEAVGAAKSVGRDRWEDVKRLIVVPANATNAKALLETEEFLSATSDERFDLIYSALKSRGTKPRRSRKAVSNKHEWKSAKGEIKAVITKAPRAFKISLTQPEALEFGDYISENLDALYDAFRNRKENKK